MKHRASKKLMNRYINQIVKRLKEERIGYDNQLATIEKCLRSKEKDSQELFLLSQDALKAKETAQSELKKYENRKLIITKLRGKYLGKTNQMRRRL